ncbi:hypothetical protein APSETT444_008699 [Aspergillus pseudonomiae]
MTHPIDPLNNDLLQKPAIAALRKQSPQLLHLRGEQIPRSSNQQNPLDPPPIRNRPPQRRNPHIPTLPFKPPTQIRHRTKPHKPAGQSPPPTLRRLSLPQRPDSIHQRIKRHEHLKRALVVRRQTRRQIAPRREPAEGHATCIIRLRPRAHIVQDILCVFEGGGEGMLWGHAVLHVEDGVGGVGGDVAAVGVVEAVALDDEAAAAEVEEHRVGALGGVAGAVDVDGDGSLGVAGRDVQGRCWRWGDAWGEGVGEGAQDEGNGFEEEVEN